MQEIKHYIDGEFVVSASGNTFDNINPATGEVISRVHEGGQPEVDRAVRAARAALRGPWGNMPVAERMAMLQRVADAIQSRAEELALAESLDNGMPLSLSRHANLPRAVSNFRQFAEHYQYVATEAWEMEGALNYALRRPLGVIGVIAPWNMPLLLTTWKLAPALATGNTVVIKPSEETPTSTALLAEIFHDILPNGVCNVVQGLGENSAGAFLSAHPDVDGITFTGETVTGQAIMASAAPSLKKLSFELGGKNPNIIFADCDLDATITGTMRSSFTNQGEVCLCGSRIYVERSRFDEFLDRFLATIRDTVRVGDPLDQATTMGALISRAHLGRVQRFLDSAREDGATLHCGGKRPDNLPDHLAGGAFLEPTVLTGLGHDCLAQRQEIFGPVVSVTPFDEEQEVLALANDTRYGLGASLWTSDLSRAHRVAGALEAGIIWVNSWFLRDLRTPFGGMKNSGIGREGGVHSLEFYTEQKNICIKI